MVNPYFWKNLLAMILELQNVILEMIARGQVLQATIERLCFEADALAPGPVC